VSRSCTWHDCLKAQLAEVDKARKAVEAQLWDINLLPQKILAQAFQ
jgi:hypothetical protein